MITAFERRLPGVSFQVQPPELAEALPRMDIAAFAGLAASGPLDTPVLIEDVARFRDIFGGEIELAWDAEAGQMQTAYLAAAVEAFFRNGGRRCWVVRAAKNPATGRFQLPGLYAAAHLEPAIASARSPGTWAEALKVGCVLESQPFTLLDYSISAAAPEYTLFLAPPASQVTAGDLLRATFADPGSEGEALLLYLFVEQASSGWHTLPWGERRLAIRISGRNAYWFTRRLPAGSFPSEVSADRLETLPVEAVQGILEAAHWRAAAELRAVSGAPDHPQLDRLTFGITVWRGEELLSQIGGLGFCKGQARFWGSLPGDQDLFGLPHGRLDQPEPTPLAIEAAGDGRQPRFPLAGPAEADFYLPVEMSITADSAAASGPVDPADMARRLSRDGLESFSADLFLDKDLAPVGSQTLLAEANRKYYLDYRPLRGFHSLLPLDEVTLVAIPDASLRGWKERTIDPPEVLAAPRLRLAASGAERGIYSLEWSQVARATSYQLVESPDPAFGLFEQIYEGAQAGFRLERLSDCPARLYYRVRALLNTQPGPWSNTELLDLLPEDFEECSQIDLSAPPLHAPIRVAAGELFLHWDSVPDATGYRLEQSEDPGFLDARLGYHGPATSVTLRLPREQGLFYYRVRAEYSENSPWSLTGSLSWETASPQFTAQDGQTELPAALGVPAWEIAPGQAETTGFDLRWSRVADATHYTLQESLVDDFISPLTVFSGAATGLRIGVQSAGVSYFRVRAERLLVSPWSDTVWATPQARKLIQMVPAAEYQDGDLLAVQRALLRFCAARADLVGVLGMPAHYRQAEALAHVVKLVPGDQEDVFEFTGSGDARVPSLTPGEDDVLSYGAIYHPWLYTRRAESQREVSRRASIMRQSPPEGAVCGTMAHRAIERGAWVAPANQPLQGVVALSPAFSSQEWGQALAAQLNLVRQDARGFLVLSADTLSVEAPLQPLNVRRLLILLRRLALREGGAHVFQPNDDVLRRLMQHRFEILLGDLYMRGAFAGTSPQSAYQVVTDRSVNTPASIDQGRFFIELRVAPSQPMAFLTVRLVQTDQGSLVVQGI